MITSGDQQQNALTPDLTPLLDLIFIVLVFLLLTTNIQIKTMEVNLPQTLDHEILESPDKEVITINIHAEDSLWAIEGKQYSDWARFTQDLMSTIKKHPNKTLVIAADKSASVEAMLKLLAFLQKNQINATNIIMDNQES
ncbi:biopolymer transporter ExbD [Vibrio sp. DW001]|uniref:ExbD/TolR family protein n=1 Tax=Vibrio sp. DW001 TaxID=2912315 RepID=UPI0023B0F84D|nr:biopolymer transporter ExbD [Vibrio sp. DW001]WED27669.1 biopolymer transporter ExbD [Vibrio sp. DW001]